MLDSDLVEIYGVPTKRLNQQMARNKSRLPPDFMFRLDGHDADLRAGYLPASFFSSSGFQSPMMDLPGHIATMGHFLQPAMSAPGQRTMGAG